MSGKGGRRCPYKECYLPDNNAKYWIQMAYLLVSGLYLVMDEKAFTFFSILMFTAPILLDLASTTLNGRAYNFIYKAYIFMNAAIAVFCLSGMFGFFVDAGGSFSVKEGSMILEGVNIPKKWFLWPLVAELFIPIMMYNACPTKKTREIIEYGREQRKAGSL